MTSRTLLRHLLVICVLSAPAGQSRAADDPAVPTTQVVLPDGYTIEAELAMTPEEQAKGLMFRRSLAEDRGMLFVFDEDTDHPFTMKHMLFDLDLLFLGPDGEIRKIVESLPHPDESTTEEETSRVRSKGKYVLELPAGFSQGHNLAVGDLLDFTPVANYEDPLHQDGASDTP